MTVRERLQRIERSVLEAIERSNATAHADIALFLRSLDDADLNLLETFVALVEADKDGPEARLHQRCTDLPDLLAAARGSALP